MANRYSPSDHSQEAFRARENERQEHVRNGTEPPPALLNQLSQDADAAMARAIAQHGTN